VPETRDGTPGYRLEAEGTLRPLLGAFVPQVVSPTGTGGAYEKKSLVQSVASPGIPSWNQLRAFLEQMQNLQKAGFAAA